MPIYRDIYDGPPRNYTATRTTKRYIAIHNTSNDASAEDEASYAKRRTDSTSSHYYVDRDSLIQSLDTDYRAWHAGSREGNDRAISYEITGVNGWTRAQWLDRVAWPLLAMQIRKDLAAHNIIAQDLTVAQITAGSLTGLITHNEMRLAWGGTTHTDPGPNFPMDYLIQLLLEDDVPIDKADVDRIWNMDGVVAAPSGYSTPNDFWSASTVLRSAQQYARAGHGAATAALTELRALAAAVAGQDVAATIRTELAGQTEQLVAAVRAAVPEANQATVEAALREVLGSLDEGGA